MARGVIQSNGKERVASGDVEYRGIPNCQTQHGIGTAPPGQNMVLAYYQTPFGRMQSFTMVDARVVARPFYLARNATIYGFAFLWHTLPSTITLDQTNQIGMYTSDGTTLTLVCSTPSSDQNNNVWKMNGLSHSTSWQHLELSSSYSATAGVYWMALVRNWSAITGSNPQTLGAQVTLGAATNALPGMGNVRTFWQLDSQNSLPSSQAWSGVTGATAAPLIYPLGDWA